MQMCWRFGIYLQFYPPAPPTQKMFLTGCRINRLSCPVFTAHGPAPPPLASAASYHSLPCTLCWMWSCSSFISVGSALYQWGNEPAAVRLILACREGLISVHLSGTVEQANGAKCEVDLCQNKPLCIRRTVRICKSRYFLCVLICLSVTWDGDGFPVA